MIDWLSLSLPFFWFTKQLQRALCGQKAGLTPGLECCYVCLQWFGRLEGKSLNQQIFSTFLLVTPRPVFRVGFFFFFPSLVCYKLWCVDEGFFPCSNDCILRFQGAVHDNPIFCVISWLSSWMKILAALKQEVRCSCSLSVLFRSMFPFSWWKVIHHLHPWILPAFFWTSFLSPWYLGPMKEINRFNTTPGPGSWEQVRPWRPRAAPFSWWSLSPFYLGKSNPVDSAISQPLWSGFGTHWGMWA